MPTNSRTIFVQVVQELGKVTAADAERITAALEADNGPMPDSTKLWSDSEAADLRALLRANLRRTFTPQKVQALLSTL